MRVSKADGSQTTDLQRDAMLAAGVDPERIYEDHASGAKDDRPQLAACLKDCARETPWWYRTRCLSRASTTSAYPSDPLVSPRQTRRAAGHGGQSGCNRRPHGFAGVPRPHADIDSG
ncbi:recombinase family protein [Tessaracoccus sp. Y36]